MTSPRDGRPCSYKTSRQLPVYQLVNSTERGRTTRRPSDETFVRLELGVLGNKNANGFERGRRLNIRFDRNGRDILYRRIVVGPVRGRSRFADERRDMPANQTIGPAGRDALERLLRGDDSAAHRTVPARVCLVYRCRVRRRNGK